MMTRLMDGFPPAPGSQVTLANWRTSPFNRWGFHHVREIVPSADIPNDPATALEFPSAPIDMGTLRIDAGGARALSFDELLVVIAKFSSQALPIDVPGIALTTRAVPRIIDFVGSQS